MIKGLFFDFDGLIMDTEYPSYLVWKNLYSRYGAELPIKKLSKIVGNRNGVSNIICYLESITGQKISASELIAQHQELLDEALKTQDIRPGVREYFEKGKQLGLKIGLVTSSSFRWASQFLERFGVLSYFDCIITGSDVEKKKLKPDPALYLMALDKLGLRSEEIIAFEDSPAGIMAAQNAGIFCVWVPNAVTQTIPFDQADLAINSMAEVPLEQLIESVHGVLCK